jgi:hypothetical protein
MGPLTVANRTVPWPAEECKDGGTIPSKEPFDFADLMQDARILFKTTDTTLESAGQVADHRSYTS